MEEDVLRGMAQLGSSGPMNRPTGLLLYFLLVPPQLCQASPPASRPSFVVSILFRLRRASPRASRASLVVPKLLAPRPIVFGEIVKHATEITRRTHRRVGAK